MHEPMTQPPDAPWSDERIRRLREHVAERLLTGRIDEIDEIALERALVRAAVAEAQREVFDFLRHVESDRLIKEFPEVRESLNAMIWAAERKARREERESVVLLLKRLRGVIRALHGPVAWDIYEKESPEMKALDAAILALGGEHDGR